MGQKYRISTDIGVDQLLTIELKQEYDLLEILSLKFTQTNAYTSYCSDYGVVVGRVTANNGFGIPNAKVSIFIPLDDVDANDPVISVLYPYKSVTDKDQNNYRYNLLPARQQHGGHNPTGTFFDQSDILNREEVLEVFEKYYKFTVKTNNSGDFMIWGVPTGQQTLHIDVDTSDMGCFSLRPNDFIRQGDGVDKFKNTYTFKASEDLNSLPQIVTFNKTIQVYPFWGNTDFCQIGISRSDFDLSSAGIIIQPKSYLIGGIFTDTGKNSVNKNCTPKKKMGRKCDLVAKPGTVTAIRFTPQKDENNNPILEEIELNEDIDSDGSFVIPLDMNMDYIVTDEFGENIVTNNPNKGIPTSACYRLKFDLKDSGEGRVRTIGSYLVPNIREYQLIGGGIDDKSYAFSTDWSDYPELATTSELIFNTVEGEHYPKDYFYRFYYNTVYTVSSFQSHYFGENFFGTVGYANINELHPSEEEDCGDKETPPSNLGVKNYTFTLLIADFLLILDFVVKWITLMFLNLLVFTLDGLSERLVSAIRYRGLRGPITQIQIQNTTKLSLVTYPECVECSTEANVAGSTNEGDNSYCIVAKFQVQGNIPSGGGADNNLLIQNFTTFTDTGGCSVSANTISNITDLFNRQTSYSISLNNATYPLQPGSTLEDYIVSGSTGFYLNDKIGLFPDSSAPLYEVIIVDTSSESGILTGLKQSLGGCSIYNTVYDDSIIHGYYVLDPSKTTPTPTGCGQADPYDGTFIGYNLNYVATKAELLAAEDAGFPLVGTAIWGEQNFAPYNPDNDKVRRFDCEDFPAQSTLYPSPNFMSLFQDGVFIIVPGTQSSGRLNSILNEYYRRKRVGLMFCGGIVNYSFVDNWLSGSLYFVQFKVKNIASGIESAIKYCRNIVRYVAGQKTFYYRSAEFDGVNFNPAKLNRPTTFVDLGPRDVFIQEICTDPDLDPNCSVSRTIGPTTYQDFSEIIELAINYRMEIAGTQGKLDIFFQNGGFSESIGINNVLDGDILQLVSQNNEVGIEPFDLENPLYLGYNFEDADPELYPQIYQNNFGAWGPLPVTLELKENGYDTRVCINQAPGIDYNGNSIIATLSKASQPVPFYLWDKKGVGFGSFDQTLKNWQSWDYQNVQVQPLQGMTYGYTIVGSPNNYSDQFALLPITYTFSGQTIPGIITTGVTAEFNIISDLDLHSDYDNEYPGFSYLHVRTGPLNEPVNGTLYVRYGPAGNWQTIDWQDNNFYIRQTQDYWGSKQILSTPFQFYFGLIHGKTGIDKFITLFGPKSAFTTVN